MREILYKSGFCFLLRLDADRIVLENKFTGLLLIFNERTGAHTIGEAIL